MTGKTLMLIVDPSGRRYLVDVAVVRQTMAELERDGVDLRAISSEAAARLVITRILLRSGGLVA